MPDNNDPTVVIPAIVITICLLVGVIGYAFYLTDPTNQISDAHKLMRGNIEELEKANLELQETLAGKTLTWEQWKTKIREDNNARFNNVIQLDESNTDTDPYETYDYYRKIDIDGESHSELADGFYFYENRVKTQQHDTYHIEVNTIPYIHLQEIKKQNPIGAKIYKKIGKFVRASRLVWFTNPIYVFQTDGQPPRKCEILREAFRTSSPHTFFIDINAERNTVLTLNDRRRSIIGQPSNTRQNYMTNTSKNAVNHDTARNSVSRALPNLTRSVFSYDSRRSTTGGAKTQSRPRNRGSRNMTQRVCNDNVQ